MIYLINTAILLIVFIASAGIIDKIISVRMCGRRVPPIKHLIFDGADVWFQRTDMKLLITSAPFILTAFSMPSHNEFYSFNGSCLNILLLFLTFPFGYGYLIYGLANKIQTRKFNIVVISYFINLFSFFVIYLVMMDILGIKDMNGFIFLQQGGAGRWLMYKNPLMFFSALISLYATSGFSPFSGISKDAVPDLNYIDEKSERFLITLGYLARYSLFVFFADIFLGGAANILTMFAKIIILNSVFTVISMLFPKIGMKNTIFFNLFLLSLVIVIRVIWGAL